MSMGNEENWVGTSAKDVLHLIHQGIATVLIASLVCDHLECKHPGITLRAMGEIYKHYRGWCKSKGPLVSGCSHRFSASRFGKEKWSSFPELASVYKAAVVKDMMYWVAAYLQENSAGVPNGELRVNCSHAFASFQSMMDCNGAFFDAGTTNQIVEIGRKGLLLYQQLCVADRQRTDGRRAYKITPKFHSFFELTFYIAESHRNPRSLCLNIEP